ncbi:MAG: class I SAM-dependent methyltransferase [Bacteroidia bacterium]|nr:class I SAM-dependent methyltransferase [Bacteroidia bacterium]
MNNTDHLKTFKKARATEKKAKIIELCTAKVVLDVGCVGQDLTFDNPDWMHNLIRKVSTSIDGVDINPEGIQLLKDKGFSVYLAEELISLNKKYDIVLLSDVIEHVNDPVAFVTFYSNFLNDSGKMVITTPNAHGIRNFTSILVRNDYSLNPEHTFWLCPKTMSEITRRANLKLVDFFWLKEYFTIRELNGFTNKIAFTFNSALQKIRTNFYPNFMFIVSK